MLRIELTAASSSLRLPSLPPPAPTPPAPPPPPTPTPNVFLNTSNASAARGFGSRMSHRGDSGIHCTSARRRIATGTGAPTDTLHRVASSSSHVTAMSDAT